MLTFSEQAIGQTLAIAKTIGACAVTGAEVGFLVGGVEGAKLGAIAGCVTGVGLLLYFSRQVQNGEDFLAYPYARN